MASVSKSQLPSPVFVPRGYLRAKLRQEQNLCDVQCQLYAKQLSERRRALEQMKRRIRLELELLRDTRDSGGLQYTGFCPADRPGSMGSYDIRVTRPRNRIPLRKAITHRLETMDDADRAAPAAVAARNALSRLSKLLSARSLRYPVKKVAVVSPVATRPGSATSVSRTDSRSTTGSPRPVDNSQAPSLGPAGNFFVTELKSDQCSGMVGEDMSMINTGASKTNNRTKETSLVVEPTKTKLTLEECRKADVEEISANCDTKDHNRNSTSNVGKTEPGDKAMSDLCTETDVSNSVKVDVNLNENSPAKPLGRKITAPFPKSESHTEEARRVVHPASVSSASKDTTTWADLPHTVGGRQTSSRTDVMTTATWLQSQINADVKDSSFRHGIVGDETAERAEGETATQPEVTGEKTESRTETSRAGASTVERKPSRVSFNEDVIANYYDDDSGASDYSEEEDDWDTQDEDELLSTSIAELDEDPGGDPLAVPQEVSHRRLTDRVNRERLRFNREQLKPNREQLVTHPPIILPSMPTSTVRPMFVRKAANVQIDPSKKHNANRYITPPCQKGSRFLPAGRLNSCAGSRRPSGSRTRKGLATDTLQSVDTQMHKALAKLTISCPSSDGTPWEPAVGNGGGSGSAYSDVRKLGQPPTVANNATARRVSATELRQRERRPSTQLLRLTERRQAQMSTADALQVARKRAESRHLRHSQR